VSRIMILIHRRFLRLTTCLLLILGAASAAPVRVLRHPNSAEPLSIRWEWALRQASGSEYQKGFWIGYSIRRRMSENHFIGSWFSTPRRDDQTLEQVLSGKPAPVLDARAAEQAVKDAARKALDEIDGRLEPEKIVDKDIGILFRFGPKSGQTPEETEFCDLKLFFKPEGRPIIWLEGAADKDSLVLLERLYSGLIPEKIQVDLIQAIARHQTPGLAMPFLERVALSAPTVPLRREAAEGLGEQDDPRAVGILKRLAERDLSADVRDDAVSALAESPVPASVDALIALASKSPYEEVRKEAVAGLAEKASENAVQTLEKVAFDDKDTEVQQEAVSALAELPPKEALPLLTKIAKTHLNPEVRKTAIQALGELNDPSVVAVLVDLIRRRK